MHDGYDYFRAPSTLERFDACDGDCERGSCFVMDGEFTRHTPAGHGSLETYTECRCVHHEPERVKTRGLW